MKITDSNRKNILELYIDTICSNISIDKETDLFIYQRLLQTKNLLSNEDLEKEILNTHPNIMKNLNETY